MRVTDKQIMKQFEKGVVLDKALNTKFRFSGSGSALDVNSQKGAEAVFMHVDSRLYKRKIDVTITTADGDPEDEGLTNDLLNHMKNIIRTATNIALVAKKSESLLPR